MSVAQESQAEIKGTDMQETSTLQRIVSLDFQRGLAIFIMVVLHSIQHIYDFTWAQNISDLLQQNVFIIILVFLIAFLSGWAGYFLIISAIVNSLAMSKRASKGHPPVQIFVKQLLNGLGILLSAVFAEGLGYYGAFGRALRGGYWSSELSLELFISRSFFMMETLHAIGWCMIINAFIQYLLIRNGGNKKVKRNAIIFAVLTIVVIAISPLVWNWVDNMNWGGFYNLNNFTEIGIDSQYFTSFRFPDQTVQYNVGTFKAGFFTLIAGDLEPLFPYLGTSFMGAFIGIILGREEGPPKRLPFYGAMTSLAFCGLGGILIAVGLPFDFSWTRPMITYFLLLMGVWIGLITFLLYMVEYRGKPAKFANKKSVRVMRLWGIISLTIFSLQIFAIFPRWLLNFLILDMNLLKHKFSFGQEGYAVLIAIFVTFAYHFLIKLWSKVNFTFSFEWFIIRFANIGSKRDISQRLNVDKLMNKVDWIDYRREEIYRTSALIICIFLGFLGIHRFYVGKKKWGLIYLFTGGLLFGGVIYDIVQIIRGKEPFTMKW